MASVVAESRPPETSTTALWDAMDMLSFAAREPLLARHVAPKVLVQLDLEAHRQPVLEDPVGELSGGQLLVARREEHGAAAFQPVLAEFRAAPLVVAAVADHELDEVPSAEPRELLITVARLLPGPRRFDIDDPYDTLVNSLERHGTARLDRDAAPRIAELSQKSEAAFLRQRLAARHADIAATQLPHPLHDRLDVPPLPAVERVFRITVLTPQRTPGEAHEHGGDPCRVSLTLQGIEDFGDPESRHLRPS